MKSQIPARPAGGPNPKSQTCHSAGKSKTRPVKRGPKSKNNIERIFSESRSCADYADKYFAYLAGLFKRIDPAAIQQLVNLLSEARRSGKQIFFIGNGGSAATSSHFANDLGKGACVKGKAPFKAMSLVDNMSLITALANDDGYENIFVAQLQNILNEGDVVVGISASGNSPNVVKAIEYANSRSAKTVGLTGFSGGKLKELAQVCVHIETPRGEYGPVEDIHMILDHLITTYLKMKLVKESEK
jgi:D-sedoheptulose 7-phosphate isomerase